MKLAFLILPLGLLAACETPTQTAMATGATGAVIGAAVAGDDNRVAGAALGGAAGLAASQLIGPANTAGNCVYRDARGERVIAPC